jgi:hypothetical protein
MSAGAVQGFKPSGTLTVAASTTSAGGKLPGGGESVLVYNASAAIAFVHFDAQTTAATVVADTPVPAGARMLFQVGVFSTYASVVLASGSGNVYFSRGDGTSY